VDEKNDFHQFLLKIVRSGKGYPPSMGITAEVAEEHQRAIAAMIWQCEQPLFEGQFIDPRTLYQFARLTTKRPKLTKNGREFKDKRFQDFYSRLCRAAAKVFWDGGILLKQENTEVVVESGKDGDYEYTVRINYFCYSKDQNDRLVGKGGSADMFKASYRTTQRAIKGHQSIKRSELNESNRAIYDHQAKLVEILASPKTQNLFQPLQLKPLKLGIKNGAIGDPKKKPDR
jgi:hypothetical protein